MLLLLHLLRSSKMSCYVHVAMLTVGGRGFQLSSHWLSSGPPCNLATCWPARRMRRTGAGAKPVSPPTYLTKQGRGGQPKAMYNGAPGGQPPPPGAPGAGQQGSSPAARQAAGAQQPPTAAAGAAPAGSAAAAVQHHAATVAGGMFLSLALHSVVWICLFS